jgi:hypothetical protein
MLAIVDLMVIRGSGALGGDAIWWIASWAHCLVQIQKDETRDQSKKKERRK